MTHHIFFSWQSDIDTGVGRNLIERALERAIGSLKADADIDPVDRELAADRDTIDVPGSPPIVDTIFGKIDRATVFAIRSTMALHAAQTMATERRGYGKLVEKRLETRLIDLGFTKAKGPNKAKISAPMHYPKYPQFYGECTVHGRKVDLFIALPDGRMIALEAKDSSSGLNSVKRILNDTAAKARHFTNAAGKNIVSVALLSGVFKIESLRQAQQADLYLVLSHDLDRFIDWVKSQTS